MITAYYFRQHMYVMVPRHLRDDLAWMADCGCDAVAVAVLEQDLDAAQANLELICAEAERVGLRVHAVPSRWGGLVAGAPKVPSLFIAKRPDLWQRNEQGEPLGFFGPTASVHAPEVYDFFCAALERLLKDWPIRGVIWDEPKALRWRDHGDWARKARPEASGPEWDVAQQAGFFERISMFARQQRDDLWIGLFLCGNHNGPEREACAGLKGIDAFGCDGRPWSLTGNDVGSRAHSGETRTKALLDQGPAFFQAARQHGKRTLMLIENHSIETDLIDVMDARLDEVLRLDADDVMFYYYPRNVAEPDRAMDVLRRHIRNRAAR